jgi:hypothetical protein
MAGLPAHPMAAHDVTGCPTYPASALNGLNSHMAAIMRGIEIRADMGAPGPRGCVA